MNAKIKVILVLILLMPLVYLLSSGTFSYLSDVETSTGNTFTAGTWYVPTQADDLEVDTNSSCVLKHSLHLVKVKNTGSSDITIEKIRISWNPEEGENVIQVLLWDWNLTTKIIVWKGNASSGTTLDIIDCTVEPWENKFDTDIFGFLFSLNSNMKNKKFTIEFIMGDGSSKAVTFAPESCLGK